MILTVAMKNIRYTNAHMRPPASGDDDEGGGVAHRKAARLQKRKE